MFCIAKNSHCGRNQRKPFGHPGYRPPKEEPKIQTLFSRVPFLSLLVLILRIRGYPSPAKHDLDCAGVIDYVIVGDDVSIGSENNRWFPMRAAFDLAGLVEIHFRRI